MRLQTWAPTASVFMWVPGIGQTQAISPECLVPLPTELSTQPIWFLRHGLIMWPSGLKFTVLLSRLAECWESVRLYAPFTLYLSRKANIRNKDKVHLFLPCLVPKVKNAHVFIPRQMFGYFGFFNCGMMWKTLIVQILTIRTDGFLHK